MKKYALVIDETTKVCQVATGTNTALFKLLGMTETDVEQGGDGNWYVSGFAPKATYRQLRKQAYPHIADQLDMMYWDKVNNTSTWQDCIAAVKARYPKK